MFSQLCSEKSWVSSESFPVAFWGTRRTGGCGSRSQILLQNRFAFPVLYIGIHSKMLFANELLFASQACLKNHWTCVSLSSLLILKFRDLSLQPFLATCCPFFMLGEVSCQDESAQSYGEVLFLLFRMCYEFTWSEPMEQGLRNFPGLMTSSTHSDDLI